MSKQVDGQTGYLMVMGLDGCTKININFRIKNGILMKAHRFNNQKSNKKVQSTKQQSCYSDAFKARLDERVSYYHNGGKMVSPEEMLQRLHAAKKRIELYHA